MDPGLVDEQRAAYAAGVVALHAQVVVPGHTGGGYLTTGCGVVWYKRFMCHKGI